MTDKPIPTNAEQERSAAEQVAEAHRILSGLRQQLDKHPDLEEAITKLELALSLLTTSTGGML
ncbi:MAG TPA: hypothetical protein VK976_12350 [Verrucomicrobiae bacterium]|jgi:hypothetical protein|nr:hypothetical protein [Verrucomicrobiae bacterium]